MPSYRKTLFILVGVAVLASGGVSYEDHLIRTNRARLADLRAQEKKMRAELARLERQHAKSTWALVIAQAESAVLPPLLADTTAGDDPLSAEMQPWLDRLQTLKRMFAEHPELGVPEMAQLTDLEWLFVARKPP